MLRGAVCSVGGARARHGLAAQAKPQESSLLAGQTGRARFALAAAAARQALFHQRRLILKKLKAAKKRSGDVQHSMALLSRFSSTVLGMQ